MWIGRSRSAASSTTGILAACDADEIAGFAPRHNPGFTDGPDVVRSWRGRSGYGLNDGAGTYLDEDRVLIGVVSDTYAEAETELHLVLNIRSLGWVATVDYGQYGPARQNSIVRGHDGRWLTYDWRTRVATVWEKDQNAQQDQLTLFDAP